MNACSQATIEGNRSFKSWGNAGGVGIEVWVVSFFKRLKLSRSSAEGMPALYAYTGIASTIKGKLFAVA
jgi:hypothetical protein